MVTAFLHAALIVTDLEKSDYLYREVLGLTVANRDLKFPGIWYQIGSCQIHLIVDAPRPNDVTNIEKLGRNRHIALAVTDLAQFKTRLQAAGYPYQLSASGRAALFLRDPDGNVIELNQVEG